MKRMHWISGALMVVTICVLSPSWLRAEQVPHNGLMVDANSSANECLSCHDGVLAKHVSFCKVRCDFSGGHSLMKRYPPAGKAAEYAPASLVIAKGIKLENGHVTCNSCHDLRKSTPDYLVIENTNSRLCLTCHIRM